MEMEIKFELENSDIEYMFTPDFRVSTNYTDETKVSWRLPSSRDALNVGVLCEEFSTEISTDPPIFGGPNVRLLP